jgi:hypothetical protein
LRNIDRNQALAAADIEDDFSLAARRPVVLSRCQNGQSTCKIVEKFEMRRDYDLFPPESRCGLSYEGWRKPRIVTSIGHAGLRGLAVRDRF